MAFYAKDKYTADGSTQTYAVTFPFISRDHVSVTADNVAATFTFVNDGQITITSPSSLSSEALIIKRNSSPATLLVDFVDGSNLTESDLDLLATQMFYLAQENIDEGGSVGFSDIDEVADAAVSTTAADLLISNGTLFTNVALSGDVTVNSSGVTAIGSSKVVSAMIANDSIVNADVKTDAAIAEKIKELKEFASSSLTRLSELYGWSKTKAAEVKNITTNIISLETDPEPLNLEDQIKLNTNKNKLSDNLVTKHRPMPGDEKTANDDQVEYLTLLQLLQGQMHMIFMERKTSGKIINERILNMEDELSKIQGNMEVLEQKWPHLEHAFPDYTSALKNKEKGQENIWQTLVDELTEIQNIQLPEKSKVVTPNVPYIKEQQQIARTVKIISKWRKSFKKNQILKMFPKNKSGNDKLRDTIAEITEAIEMLGPNKDLTAVRDTLTTELNTRDSLTKKYEKNKGNPWDDINLPSRSGK